MKRMFIEGFFLSWVLVCFLTFFAAEVNGATIVVGPPPASIQTAINSASSGDTIQLSAGTYVEEIQVVSKSLNIFGAGRSLTTIQSPSAATHLTQNFSYGGFNWWCVVMVDNQAAPTAQTVNISNLTVDGSNQQDTVTSPIYGNSDRFFAIAYHNANGAIQNVHTTNTRQTSNFNELAGGGIVNASDTGTVTFTVDHCLVDFYQRIGIDCRGTALTATVSNSTVNRGYVLTPNTTTATPNGIQFSGSARGSVNGNTVSGNIATVFNASATGILLFGAGSDVIASGNTANNNDLGIIGISCGNNLTISNNQINFTTTPGVNPVEGIAVQDTSGLSTIISNVMNNVPNVNMDLSSSTDQPFLLMNNQFFGSQVGLLVTGATSVGPIISMNSDSFVGTMGYYIQEVTSPHDIWPSTSTVSFDGLISGHMTTAEFNLVLTKIYDQHNDPTLGLVLDFIPPSSPVVTCVNPNFGSTSGGGTVTIQGSGFISSNTQVFFGSNPASDVVVVSDTEITATVPSGTGTVDVFVVTPFGNSPTVPADNYTYLTGSCS